MERESQSRRRRGETSLRECKKERIGHYCTATISVEHCHPNFGLGWVRWVTRLSFPSLPSNRFVLVTDPNLRIIC